MVRAQGNNRINILVAVTGGIAAYKTVEICNRLIKKGFNVQVMMTQAAKEFVSPLTFETVTQNPVASEMFQRDHDWDVEHISVARWADMMLVCPATANIIGKLAHGICDDFVTTTLIASEAPCLLAPAMNTSMYHHPAVQKNLNTLRAFGYQEISPGHGHLACGETGKGRLADVEEIISSVLELNAQIDAEMAAEKKEKRNSPLSGKTVLVTAGATRERLDPVRFISNPSSGKMGLAIAEAAIDRGAQVVLVAGHITQPPPEKAEVVYVHTTEEMYEQVMHYLDEADVIVKCAAVNDFRPETFSESKIKKTKLGDKYSVSLVPTPDILQEVGRRKGNRVLVGFAAETDDLIENAREKLERKNADMMVVNDISTPESGFESDYNTIKILFPTGDVKSMPSMSKVNLGKQIIDEIEHLIEQ